MRLADLAETSERLAAIPGRNEKIALLAQRLRELAPAEAPAAVAWLSGHLRQGRGDAVGELRRAAMVAGSVERVAVAGLLEGRAGLERFALRLFQPVQPMLAQPAADLDDALRRLGAAALEHKLDGVRIQAHRSGSEVRVYSRRLHDVTASLPEVVEAVGSLPLADAILDGEAIALRGDGHPYPFQVTM